MLWFKTGSRAAVTASAWKTVAGKPLRGDFGNFGSKHRTPVAGRSCNDGVGTLSAVDCVLRRCRLRSRTRARRSALAGGETRRLSDGDGIRSRAKMLMDNSSSPKMIIWLEYSSSNFEDFFWKTFVRIHPKSSNFVTWKQNYHKAKLSLQNEDFSKKDEKWLLSSSKTISKIMTRVSNLFEFLNEV